MASINTPIRTKEAPKLTFEGAKAATFNDSQKLRRAVLSCFLWEDQFYEDGVAIADRITELASKVPPQELASLAVEARNDFHLRHVPLLLLNVLTKTGAGIPHLIPDTFEATIQRPDEMAEFLAIYFKDGKHSLSAGAKKGLARAFSKFSQYSLAKYKGTGDKVSLRDVMFMSHPKPRADQEELFKKIADKTLEAPDTWEVELSAGKDKKETFTRLLQEGKLGYMALLRNLRNMEQVGVDRALISQAIITRKNGAENILPFRYIAALKAAPSFGVHLDYSMQESVKDLPTLSGKTIVLVDVSGSMDYGLSGKSDMNRIDAACALAVFINGEKRVFSFSDKVVEVPQWNGMAGISAISKSQTHNGTYLGKAIAEAVEKCAGFDRIIVITDEQSHDKVSRLPDGMKGYMTNVASYENGIGHKKDWVRINGFSENVIRYIHEVEKENLTEVS